MAGVGHAPALLSTEASGRCRFSQATFAGAHGNWRDAPIPAVRGTAIEPPESLRVIRCLPFTWRCGSLRGQASDKPREEETAGRHGYNGWGALELWGFESRGQMAATWSS